MKMRLENDPMGAAIAEYHRKGKAGKLRVFSSQFDEDEMPVDILFRDYENMPKLEQKALELAKGRILDVGAGSGCHALVLQDMRKEVVAIEISDLSVEVMKERGVYDARKVDFYDPKFTEKFDTILMLMNGSGLIGKIENMSAFFNKVRDLLSPGGSVLMDSSDLRYLYEDEDGNFDIDLAGDYYGEIDYWMKYKDIKGESFDCLYVDFETLSYHAEESGFTTELIAEGDHYDYLARLQIKNLHK